MSNECTLPIHPFTRLRAVGIVAGRPVWPIMGGSGEGDGEPGGDGYKAPASQEEFDQIFEKRLARERAKLSAQYADYDDVKAKAAKHDAMELELGSTADKAAAKARDEARAEVLAEATPRLVTAEFKAAAKGVLAKEQLAALLEDLDLSKYVTDKGDVDEEKVQKKVDAFAPKNNGGGNNQSRDLGQGNRQGVQPKPGELGRAEAAKRFKTGS